MTEQNTPSCSDVIVAFQEASAAVGLGSALMVLRNFGAQYAATVPEAHRLNAIRELIAITKAQQKVTSEPDVTAVEAIKAKWREAS